jgi:heat-inducible transcriptional repressor
LLKNKIALELRDKEKNMSYPAIHTSLSENFLVKASHKRDSKAQELLFGLIDLYISSNKPIGSQTLKDQGFGHLSSATIRNYFALLDKEGLLEQIHTSGGRVPTDLAWRRYFDTCTLAPIELDTLSHLKVALEPFVQAVKQGMALYDVLSLLCEALAQLTKCACFLLSPSFEQDHLTHIKIWPIQADRWAIITRSQMGFIDHEILPIRQESRNLNTIRIEQLLEQRIRHPFSNDTSVQPQEHRLVQEIYNELMIRHLVRHTYPSERVWLKAGLSNLLNHPELAEAEKLATALSFFERRQSKDHLQQLMKKNPGMISLIGQELQQLHLPSNEGCLIASPFYIHQQMAGLLGIIGPKRVPYKRIRQILEYASQLLNHHLTRQYYSFKLTYENNLAEESIFSSH